MRPVSFATLLLLFPTCASPDAAWTAGALTTPSPALLLAAHGVDAQRFVVAGGGRERDPAVLWRTTDGGRTFAVPDMPAVHARLYDVHFAGRELGFACGLRGTLLRTNDGGATWQSVELPCGAAWLAAVHFADERIGLIAGAEDGPLLLRTGDGGHRWHRVETSATEVESGRNLRDVRMLDREVGLACGDGGLLLRTTDGGRSWHRVASGSTAWLRHLAPTAAGPVFVVAGDGQLLASEDRGLTWQSRGKVPGKPNSATFADHRTGLVVTMDGLAYATTDGGRTFAVHYRHRAELCDVALLEPGRVVCVGGQGLVCRLELPPLSGAP